MTPSPRVALVPVPEIDVDASAVAEPDDLLQVGLVGRYDVLGHPIRPELQAIAQLAAQVCGTPMATINLLTDVEQHHVAAYGIDPIVCRREDSMCHPVLDGPTPVVVEDCSLDARFEEHPFVNGERGAVRFYASHQLLNAGGETIGTLCVYDTAPRRLVPGQVEALGTLAERVVDVLELSLRSRELSATNDRLSAFARRVSHDLKSPLASVSLSLGLLREHVEAGRDPQDALDLVDRALSSTARMTVLVDQVLEHATAGDRPDHRRVDLDDLLDEVLVDLAAALVDVRVDRRPLPIVRGDAVQLRTLLQNLLDNAAKHRHPDRPLVVSVHAERRRAAWRTVVTDNGRGIPVEDRTRVFQPDIRLAEDHVQGSGIGLDTCRRVAEEHGGAVGAGDGPEGPDVGVSVWFELPD